MPYKFNPFTGDLDVVSGSGESPTPSSSLAWSTITTATHTVVANNGYFANRPEGVVAFTLPATAKLGDTFVIVAQHANGFTLAQNALQYIQITDATTTIGITGSIASNKTGDVLKVVCCEENVGFIAIGSMNNLTVI